MIKSTLLIKMNNGETFYYTGEFPDHIQTAYGYLVCLKNNKLLSINRNSAIVTEGISSVFVIDRNI